jgi:Protein of unknown function (DUF2971)
MNSAEYENKISFMNQWSDSVRSELASLISDNPPGIIYHYTDVNGLIGLIKDGCIWATHVSRLNDSSENKHGFNLVTKFVLSNLPESSKPLIEKALAELHSVDTYVACYSTKDDLLSQWRNYTGSSVGYSLGFATEQMATTDYKMPLLEQVIYKDSIAKSVLTRLLDKVDEFVNNNSFGEVEVGYLLGIVQATLNNIACIIKHHKFEEENEYRQFYQPGNTCLELEPDFRAGQFGLTPYVKIHFLEKERLPLKSVTVGPCQDIEIESNVLKILLSKHGYDHVEVLKSEIPLRV